MSSSKFHLARINKFVLGSKTHKEHWPDVAFGKELSEECLDIWNYADGLQLFRGRLILGLYIKIQARLIYWFLNK